MSTTRKLFFSLWPDYRQRDRLRDVIAPAVRLIDGRAIPRDNWHLTLLYVGEFPEVAIPGLLQQANALQSDSFRLRFDKVEFWARARVACLVPSTVPTELARLNQQLKNLLSDAGFLMEEQRFRPHITICRNARPFETQRLAQPLAVEWSSFELLESTRVRGETRYVPLKQELSSLS
ncbi:MAG: RNA 2',3'-cyclic phosphodiesterase [Pseudomonadota bacterium]